jgi:hypothetical protein
MLGKVEGISVGVKPTGNLSETFLVVRRVVKIYVWMAEPRSTGREL